MKARGGLVIPVVGIPVVSIEQTRTSDRLKTLAAIANWLIWLVVLAEVVLMMSIVLSRKRWLIDNPLDVAIVVLTPSWRGSFVRFRPGSPSWSVVSHPAPERAGTLRRAPAGARRRRLNRVRCA